MESTAELLRDKSQALFDEAKEYFPGGVNSPVRAFKSVSGPPLFIKEGNGSRIIDEDENEYLDFCCSWGPLILGHAYPSVIDFIQKTLVRGTSFGTPNRLGNQLAKLILDNNPYVDKIRFVSSGTEAVMSAIRLARGFTKKNKIIKFEGCYHGHVDSLLVRAGSGLATFGESTSAGIPQGFIKETLVVPLNDLEQLEKCISENQSELAAVIIEPVPANNGLLIQDKAYLEAVRALCDRYNCLLIFDEVISGFRVGFTGAAGYYDIKPDIITYGKIIGGGMPVGAYGASHEIMSHIAPDGPVYQAGTLSANPVAMAAGYQTLQELLKPGVYESLADKTTMLANSISSFAQDHNLELRVQNIGSIFWLSFSKDRVQSADQIQSSGMEKFKILHHELLQSGVYLGPSGYEVGFVSVAHSPADLEEAIEKMKAALLKACA